MANLFRQGQPTQQVPPQNQQLLQQIRANPRAYVGQLKQDPAGFLRQFGYNVPDGMTDPAQIVQRLFGSPPLGMFGGRR